MNDPQPSPHRSAARVRDVPMIQTRRVTLAVRRVSLRGWGIPDARGQIFSEVGRGIASLTSSRRICV
jgi:hypothetical protein